MPENTVISKQAGSGTTFPKWPPDGWIVTNHLIMVISTCTVTGSPKSLNIKSNTERNTDLNRLTSILAGKLKNPLTLRFLKTGQMQGNCHLSED